jgi:hypothetical protein
MNGPAYFAGRYFAGLPGPGTVGFSGIAEGFARVEEGAT